MKFTDALTGTLADVPRQIVAVLQHNAMSYRRVDPVAWKESMQAKYGECYFVVFGERWLAFRENPLYNSAHTHHSQPGYSKGILLEEGPSVTEERIA